MLEAAEVSLTAWNRDRKDKERVAELQRQLHTLKGGARMAGISAMGDLSHELETLVIQIDGGSVAGDDHAHAVMQASLDELARMRDLVSNGTLPGGATALMAQIRDLAESFAKRPLRPPRRRRLRPPLRRAASRPPHAPSPRRRRLRRRSRCARIARPTLETSSDVPPAISAAAAAQSRSAQEPARPPPARIRLRVSS